MQTGPLTDEGAKLLALGARLDALRRERDADRAAAEAALAEVDRLRELVVSLQTRLDVLETTVPVPRMRGLASLIAPASGS